MIELIIATSHRSVCLNWHSSHTTQLAWQPLTTVAIGKCLHTALFKQLLTISLHKCADSTLSLLTVGVHFFFIVVVQSWYTNMSLFLIDYDRTTIRSYTQSRSSLKKVTFF